MGFDAQIGDLNQVCPDVIPMKANVSSGRLISDPVICKRGTNLIDCLELRGFAVLNEKFKSDCPAILTCLSSGGGSTTDVAACALSFIEVISDLKIVPIATRSNHLPFCVELLLLGGGELRKANTVKRNNNMKSRLTWRKDRRGVFQDSLILPDLQADLDSSVVASNENLTSAINALA